MGALRHGDGGRRSSPGPPRLAGLIDITIKNVTACPAAGVAALG